MHAGIMIFEDGAIISFGQIGSSRKMIPVLQSVIEQLNEQEKKIAIEGMTATELEKALTMALEREHQQRQMQKEVKEEKDDGM
jgi:hypothetical protein